jgi:hypothetical protein
LRNTGIVPIRKMIPAAMQNRPTAAGSVGELTDTEQPEHRNSAGETCEHGRSKTIPFETAER